MDQSRLRLGTARTCCLLRFVVQLCMLIMYCVHADPYSKLLEIPRTVSQRILRKIIQARLDSGSRRPRNFDSRMYFCVSLLMLPKAICVSYWDWAEPRVEEEGLPPVFYEEKLNITVAGGQTQAIDNPFAFYTYQDSIPPDFANETNSEVCLKRVHILLSELFTDDICRLRRRRISRNGLEPIDMLQARKTPPGVTSMPSKRLHLLSTSA